MYISYMYYCDMGYIDCDISYMYIGYIDGDMY